MSVFLAVWVVGSLPVLLAERVHSRSLDRRFARDRGRECARWLREHPDVVLEYGGTVAAPDSETRSVSARRVA